MCKEKMKVKNESLKYIMRLNNIDYYNANVGKSVIYIPMYKIQHKI